MNAISETGMPRSRRSLDERKSTERAAWPLGWTITGTEGWGVRRCPARGGAEATIRSSAATSIAGKPNPGKNV
jgi:hypothetical protein